MHGILCMLSLMAFLPAFAAEVKVMANDPEGLPAVTIGGGEAMGSQFVFWGSQWKWTELKSGFKYLGPIQYEVNGNDPDLGLSLHEHIARLGNNGLRWDIDLDAKESLPDVVGGGMVFRFDLNAYRDVLGEPRLLSNNHGWVWGKPGAKDYIEMRFEPALAAVFFEQKNVNEIRAYFYNKAISAGHRHYVATLTGNVGIAPTQAERFGADGGAWTTQGINWKHSPIDMSFLNLPEIPAGKHGFLKAVGDKLVFGDGTQARFWGTNLTAYALFGTPKETVRQQARRLSQLGFNLVRLHHHDSPWVDPNIFGNQAKHANTPDPVMLEKLDWWIKCLKDEGIYVWLDMHAQRFLNREDKITAFDEISHGNSSADLKGYNYVNPSIQKAMKNFSLAYLNHVNRYTGMAYKDEPAIAAILITNENDLTNHFGNALLPANNVPWHDEQYMREAKEFAAKNGMNANLVWRSWEPGPSKYFLNDLEHRFDADMIAYLHGMGVKAPIVTTNTWGGNPLNSLPALTTGDMIDVHSYGGSEEIGKNPVYTANMMDWIAAGQVAGKPMTVSEWNVSPYPVTDRYDAPIYIAAVASHQGWDAVMQYAYSVEAITGSGNPSNWESYNDPALLATMPAAALMFRQGHVREATTTYAFAPAAGQFFDQNTAPPNSVALRTAVELGKLTVAMPQTRELPWLKPGKILPGTKVITDPKRSLLPSEAKEAISDTGELKRNWEKGVYTINTPRTQAAMGWIGGQKIVLPDVEIDIVNKNATVAVQSMDGKPIKASKDVVITVAGPSRINDRMHEFYYAQPFSGTVSIAAPEGLNPSGKEKISYSDGHYLLKLSGHQSAYRLTGP